MKRMFTKMANKKLKENLKKNEQPYYSIQQ